MKFMEEHFTEDMSIEDFATYTGRAICDGENHHYLHETISNTDITISESSPAPDNSLKLKDPDKDQDRIIEAYSREGSWTGEAKLAWNIGTCYT